LLTYSTDFSALNALAPTQAQGGATRAATLPTYSTGQIANFLAFNWLGGASFNTGTSRSLTVDTSVLTPAGRQLASWALEAWTSVTGITFIAVTSGAQITFDDSQAGAFAGPDSVSNNTIFSSSINIGTGWLASYGTGINSYSYMTYMHEIGHALGLDHSGFYNAGGSVPITYATDGTGSNHYLNDSWQASIMSYFSPNENTSIAANWDYYAAGFSGVLTPMAADIQAMQILYGVAGTIRTGDTTYGVGSNLGQVYNQIGASQASYAFTIIDEGGIDKINLSNVTASQIVDLTPGAFSSIGGLVDNMIITSNTIIENIISGSGGDTITGNDAANVIWGGGGADVVRAGSGDDIIRGGTGNDILNGNHKHDLLIGEGGDDILRGGAGRDKLDGGTGDDILMGGIGRDKLTGGSGADTFVFKSGWAVDRVNDFEDNIDTISLETALWGGGLTVAQVVSTFGSVVANYASAGSHVELNFGGGDTIKIFGISTTAALLDDITIF
jgi:serralysin